MPNRWPLVPHDLFLMLIESWFDEITTCQWPCRAAKKIHGGGGRIRPGNTINSPRNRLKIRFRGRHQKVKWSQIAPVTITSGRALSSSFVFIVCAESPCKIVYTKIGRKKTWIIFHTLPGLPCRTQVRQNRYIFAVARDRDGA